MKKGRFLCIALALCVMMTLTSYAAEAPAYTTCTFQSHNGVVFTFEAARKISRKIGRAATTTQPMAISRKTRRSIW